MSTVAVRPQTAAERREEERKSRSNTDRLLLTYARLALSEIEEKTGIPASEAGLRLNELLRARDHLSERQEERLLIIELGDLIDDVKGRMSGANNDNYADIANVALRGYEAIAKRFDARRKLTEADMAEITRSQGEMFLAILLESINIAANYLEELHPDLEFDIRNDLEAAFDFAIPQAQVEVNKRVRE